MAMTECARYIFINWAALGGSSGISIFSKKVNKYLYLQLSANSDKVTYYDIVLAVVVALIAFTMWLDSSRFGHHGNCKECVAIHRAHQEHVPNCMRPMLNRKIRLLSELTEHTLANEIEPPHEILRGK